MCVSAAAHLQALCQDQVCSAHEFCGVDTRSGETRCHCRAIFASKYKPTNSFGESAVAPEHGVVAGDDQDKSTMLLGDISFR